MDFFFLLKKETREVIVSNFPGIQKYASQLEIRIRFDNFFAARFSHGTILLSSAKINLSLSQGF